MKSVWRIGLVDAPWLLVDPTLIIVRRLVVQTLHNVLKLQEITLNYKEIVPPRLTVVPAPMNAEINRLPPAPWCVGFEIETSVTEYFLGDEDMYRVGSDRKLTPSQDLGKHPEAPLARAKGGFGHTSTSIVGSVVLQTCSESDSKQSIPYPLF